MATKIRCLSWRCSSSMADFNPVVIEPEDLTKTDSEDTWRTLLLRKRSKIVEALKGVALRVNSGEIHGLLVIALPDQVDNLEAIEQRFPGAILWTRVNQRNDPI